MADLVIRIPAGIAAAVEDDAEILKALVKLARRVAPEAGLIWDAGRRYAVRPGQYLTTLNDLADLLRCSREKARAVLARGGRLGLLASVTVWPDEGEPGRRDTGQLDFRSRRTLITLMFLRDAADRTHSEPTFTPTADARPFKEASSYPPSPPSPGAGPQSDNEQVGGDTPCDPTSEPTSMPAPAGEPPPESPKEPPGREATAALIAADWQPRPETAARFRSLHPDMDLDAFVEHFVGELRRRGESRRDADQCLLAWAAKELNRERFSHAAASRPAFGTSSHRSAQPGQPARRSPAEIYAAALGKFVQRRDGLGHPA